jgi:RNA polymerase sigma factor (sigma-70 family)
MGGRHLEESQLVDRARDGDVAAYEALMRMYQNIATRTAYVITGDGADAQDAVQEAFIKAYYALGRFRTGAPFRPWLLRIVANEAINRRRAARRHVNLALRAMATEDRSPGDAGPSPEGAALALEQQRELVVAMGRLRPEDRLVIAYRYWMDLSESEMAEALGCARGTVKSRLSRALKRLRREIEPARSSDAELEALPGGLDG